MCFVQKNVTQPIPNGFLTNTDNSQFEVLVGGEVVATVTHREITIVDENRDVQMFRGQGWRTLVQLENIVAGTRVVLTNLLNNSVSLMPFLPSGLEMHHDVVERMVLNCRRPFMKSPVDEGLLATIRITYVNYS